MSGRSALAALAGAAAIGALAVGSRAATGPAVPPPPPLPPPSDFVSQVDNRYFPLEPGTTFLYRGKVDGKDAEDTVLVTGDKKTILGVDATVVSDRVTQGGKPHEKTFDWYAQDKRGNVWYLGEDAFDWVHGHWV